MISTWYMWRKLYGYLQENGASCNIWHFVAKLKLSLLAWRLPGIASLLHNLTNRNLRCLMGPQEHPSNPLTQSYLEPGDNNVDIIYMTNATLNASWSDCVISLPYFLSKTSCEAFILQFSRVSVLRYNPITVAMISFRGIPQSDILFPLHDIPNTFWRSVLLLNVFCGVNTKCLWEWIYSAHQPSCKCKLAVYLPY